MNHILNVTPIIYNESEIHVEKVKYSDEAFEHLQNIYRGSHLIKRSGDSILLVPFHKGSFLQGEKTTTINLKENLSLAASLARGAMYRELVKRDCWISTVKPISYLVTKKNLLDECLPQGSVPIKGIGVYVKWELDFRVIDPLGKGSYIGMSINLSTAPRISISCQSLIDAGMPITGYYVGTANQGRNPELKPRFSTVGRAVKMLENGMLQLDDVREGLSNEVDPLTVYLEPREDILEHCIRYFYKDQAHFVLSNLEKLVMTYHVGNRKLEKMTTALRSYQQFDLNFVEDLPFKLGDFLSNDGTKSQFLNVATAEKPLFVFSYGGTHNSYYNDPGIQKYGPYSKETFTPAKPRICVICQVQKKGQVELVLQKFLNGIPPMPYGKNKTFEFTGLKTKFYLQDCTIDFFVTTDDSVAAYNKAITAAMQASATDKKWDIAFIQIDKHFRELKTDQNPYFVAKSRFVSQGIPVQEFTLESLGLPDEKVFWIFNNMALATYAKLGGVPWLLTADKPIAHEVVFGIGSAMVHSSRLGVQERMIGITTVFTGDGNYFINNISAAVRAEDYFETLLLNLRTTMGRVKQWYNWQPRDTVRLIFHAFKTFKDAEADAVKQVMSELGDYNVEFAFVHVAAAHPYLLFDTNQRGLYNQKGIFAPDRAKYVRLSENMGLVCLTGAQEVKKPSDGLPRPVQIILHKDSTFKDLTYLSKQVIKFGAHSWRSFQPAPMPVTVFYSQLMAQMLSQLAGVSSWNSDALFDKIGSTRWFL